MPFEKADGLSMRLPFSRCNLAALDAVEQLLFLVADLR